MTHRRMLRPVINYFKRPRAGRRVGCPGRGAVLSLPVRHFPADPGVGAESGGAPRLDLLRPERIRDTLHAHQLAKRCNEKRVMAESVRWGARGAFITGADFLIDGGATASYFYGPLKPES